MENNERIYSVAWWCAWCALLIVAALVLIYC